MHISSFTVLLAVAVTRIAAKTPAGFIPASDTDLILVYGTDTSLTVPLNGVVTSKAATAAEPQIGTTKQLTGTSFAVLMIDLDIPTNKPPATNTLLHWMQTGLTAATTAKTINTANGKLDVFFLQNGAATAAAAPYFGPNPPAKIPLSHRYTQILIDTSAATPEGLIALTTAAKNRQGFNAEQVLTQVGLAQSVVAGNSFNVTNGGGSVV